MSLPVIVVAGVDRSGLVELVNDIRLEDVRGSGSSGGAASVLVSFRPTPGWRPAGGMAVAISYGGRGLFAGEITHVERAKHGLTWCDDCTVTAKLFLLDRTAPVYASYVGQSASAIFADLMTRAPAEFTATAIEAGLATIADIQFPGVSLWEAIQRTAAAIGAVVYLDEDNDLHAYVTTDAGVEQPDTVTLANTREGTIRPVEDWSQVETRVYVEGPASSLASAAPVFAGDTTIPVADASGFSSPAGIVQAGAAQLAYSGVMQNYDNHYTEYAGATYNPIGGVRLGVNNTVGLPASGWLFTQDGRAFRYTGISPWDVAVLMPGHFLIQSITQGAYVPGSGYPTTLTLTTNDAVFCAGYSSAVLGIYGTTSNNYNYHSFTATYVAPNQVAFYCAVSVANLGQQGYCGLFRNPTITDIQVTAGVATVTLGWSARKFVVGDWITISGNSYAPYNGTWPVLGVPDSAHLTFKCPNSRWTGSGGVCDLAGVPRVSLSEGTPLVVGECLTGVTGAPALAEGSSLTALVQVDDVPAQEALAAATGGDGIRVGPVIQEGSLTLAAAAVRGQAELAVRKDPEIRLSYSSLDPKTRAGASVTVDVHTPAYPDLVLADSPTGYWRLGELVGTTAADASGHAHPLTLVGSPTLGADGALLDGARALESVGSGHYGYAAHHADWNPGSNPFSVEARVRGSSWAAGKWALWHGSDLGNAAGWGLAIETGGITFVVGDGAAHATIVGAFTTPDRWYHVVAVVDRAAGFLRLYVDGAAVTPVSLGAVGSLNVTAQLQAGVGNATARLQDLAIYPSALSSTRVTVHYAARLQPAPITGTFKVTKVQYSGFNNGPAATIRRDVEASNKRFSPADLFRQWSAA